MVALCYLAILFAWVDDSIAACTDRPDDDQAAALDNEYVVDHSPLLLAIELLSTPTWHIANGLPLEPCHDSATPIVADRSFTDPRDIFLIIMLC
jgi:hypothetical protein